MTGVGNEIPEVRALYHDEATRIGKSVPHATPTTEILREVLDTDGMVTTTISQHRHIIKESSPPAVHSPTSSLEKHHHRALLSYHQIPAWQKDNKFVHRGYRPESHSTKACFSSWLSIHNETFNIFSHLIPAVVFLGFEAMAASLISHRYPQAKFSDYTIFACFLFTVFITLSLSTTYHTMMNHSMRISHFWLQMDYVGILLLTLGDFVSGVYICFYCDRTLQIVYWIMILTLSFITTVLVIHPSLQGLKWRFLRVGAFVITGSTGFVPIVHGLAKYGWDHMWAASGMPYYVIEGGILAFGTLFYSTRFPESGWPGKFDIWGCSHNIFHVLVVLATSVHFVGIWQAYDWNYHNAACRR